MIYDAIVIGTGPAGATAARELARRNLNVVMLERSKLPRYKPCGGGLTSKVIESLDFDISATIEDQAQRVVLSYDSGAPLMKNFPRTAVWLVMRDKFDYLLAQKAVEAGAELRESAKVDAVEPDDDAVSVRTARETLRARFVVGADGANGITAKAVGLMKRRHDGAALEGEITVPSSVIEKWHGSLLLDFGSIPWGYAWIFPKAEHLSIGVGTYYPSGKIKLRDYLTRFVAKQPDLREHAALLTKGHLVPLGGRTERFENGRVALAGDAAAMADPFIGEGISHAIHSGRIAAEEIAAALMRGDTNLTQHTRRVNREINNDFRYARLATQIFYRWPRLSYRMFLEGGELLSSAMGVVEGGTSYRQLMFAAVSRSPHIAWRRLLRAAAT